MRITRTISPELNESAKRYDLHVIRIKQALKHFMDSNKLEAASFITKEGTFGIEKADKTQAINFINAISKTSLTKYMSPMKVEEFKTGQGNLNEETFVKIESDGEKTYKVTFGSKKSTNSIVKSLLGKTKKGHDIKKEAVTPVQVISLHNRQFQIKD